ncbi:MAG TPA: enoyl-CoA hydratase/isomerase family protein [Casimicrobiaceae bacterium]|nr:enoyl-CoA hydratase/isomerase family protein [Casimicrobiaceae bacterium]
MALQHLKLTVDDYVATLVLNRPPVNALGRAIREELLATFDELHDRDDVRVVVLTGSGATFCAGADIKERTKLTGRPGEYRELNRLVREVFYGAIQCHKPIIAAVNGAALGAGFALALCCDIILASEEAVFGMPEVDVGLAGGVKFLQRYFSPSQSRMLLITGRRVPASELYRLGALQACVSANELLPEATKLAREIAAKSPLAVQMLKQSFNTVESLSLADGYRIEQDMTIQLSKTEDAQEAKRAFVEKRKPVFKGR